MGQLQTPVLFICEHGAAKSVIAAAWFNRYASERGLSLRAISRGITPDSEFPQPVINGLANEGLKPDSSTPLLLSAQDLAGAARVITFDQPGVAGRLPPATIAQSWDGLPPVSAGFEAAQVAIVGRVAQLFETRPE
jgi:arsenate reductase